MGAPGKTTARAFPSYASGEMVADSIPLDWPGIYVRRMRFPSKLSRFLVPAIPEPLFSCVLGGTSVFRERDMGADWIEWHLSKGDIFVTHSKEPYVITWTSPPGEEMDTIMIHFAVDQFLSSFDRIDPGKREEFQVVDFFGRDPVASGLFEALAEMLVERVSGSSCRVSAMGEMMALSHFRIASRMASDTSRT